VPSGLRHQRHSRTRVGLSPFERLRLRLGSQDGPRPGYSPTATRREVDAYLNELAMNLARCPACASATWAEHRG
jgi:hypothetical protein